MFRTFRSSNVLLAILALAGGSPAFAGDYYVDATTGNDANSGLSPASAWRTISYAVTQLPAGEPHVVRVAPGLYDSQHGELFPIDMQPQLRLTALDPSQRPTLRGGATAGLIRFIASAAPTSQSFDETGGLEHLKLSGGTAAVLMSTAGAAMRPQLRDLTIAEYIYAGVDVRSLSGSACEPLLERVEFVHGGQESVSLSALGSVAGTVRIGARDCGFRDSRNYAVRMIGSVEMTLDRCVLQNNLGAGVHMLSVESGSRLSLLCRDSLLAANFKDAVRMRSFTDSDLVARLERCTLAGNLDMGVSILDQSSGGLARFELQVEECILDNPLGDVRVEATGFTLEVRNSLVRDGQFDGVNGCFSADPRFRDASGGDLRLSWDSPCIDVAPTAAASGVLDLAGRLRNVDGDLDTQRRPDLGALEFETLELDSSGALGSPLRLSISSSVDSLANVYWARTSLSTPMSTLFGAFELDPLRAAPFSTVVAPAQLSRTIPASVLLVGHTFSFQALVDSASAPLARAFTNGVEVTIVP